MPEHLSPTSIKLYQSCPRAYYYCYHPEISKKTDYPRLCGSEVHSHISKLHQPTKDQRPFYYKDKESFRGAWYHKWERACEKNKDKLVGSDDKKPAFYNIGLQCISNYYDQALNKLRPLEIESRYKFMTPAGVKLLGIFDQVRTMPVEFIASLRPEIVKDGKLDENYDPVAIVDLKTDYLSYDVKAFKENTTLYDEVRWQYRLHEEIQATAYTYLYKLRHGRWPSLFLWWHLRSGQVFPTYREVSDVNNLLLTMKHVLDNIEQQSFPKHVSGSCKTCDYIEPCREDRHFLVSSSYDLPESEAIQTQLLEVPSLMTASPLKQRRLKGLVVPRQKRPLPEAPSVLKPSTTLSPHLPWEDD